MIGPDRENKKACSKILSPSLQSYLFPLNIKQEVLYWINDDQKMQNCQKLPVHFHWKHFWSTKISSPVYYRIAPQSSQETNTKTTKSQFISPSIESKLREKNNQWITYGVKPSSVGFSPPRESDRPLPSISTNTILQLGLNFIYKTITDVVFVVFDCSQLQSPASSDRLWQLNFLLRQYAFFPSRWTDLFTLLAPTHPS